MDEAEFDRYAIAYEEQHRNNIALTGEDPAYFSEYKVKLFSSWVGNSVRRVIDFGTGIGNSIPYFRKHLATALVTCADISQKSLEYASRRYPGSEQKVKVSREGIPAANDFYDAAFSACVFHHIPHSEHEFWLRELLRVVRPGGTIAIFEHNPFNPLTRRAVNTCPFDENAVLVRPRQIEAALRHAGWQPLQTRYHIFFPRFAAVLRRFEPLMGWLPLGAQYSVCGQKPW